MAGGNYRGGYDEGNPNLTLDEQEMMNEHGLTAREGVYQQTGGALSTGQLNEGQAEKTMAAQAAASGPQFDYLGHFSSQFGNKVLNADQFLNLYRLNTGLPAQSVDQVTPAGYAHMMRQLGGGDTLPRGGDWADVPQYRHAYGLRKHQPLPPRG